MSGLVVPECRGLSLFLWSVSVVGLVLAVVAVPEVVAGAAYAAAMSALSTGIGWGGAIAGALAIVGC